MAKEKPNKPGKVMYQILGLRVRLTPKGEYGIYAGKHLYQAYASLELAQKIAKKIVERKPSYHAIHKAFDQWMTSRKGK